MMMPLGEMMKASIGLLDRQTANVLRTLANRVVRKSLGTLVFQGM
jgi:hypothetical protein